MAITKFVLLFCVAVSYSSALRPVLHQQDLHHTLKNAESDAIALLEKLTDAVKAIVPKAMTVIVNLLDELDETAESLIADIKSTFNATITPFLNAIEKLEKEAEQAAVDITDCVGTSIDDINALPVKFLSNVTSCIDTKLATAKEYVNQTYVDITSTFDVIDDLGAEIYVCGNESFVQQVVCFTELTAKITADIVSLPLKITDDVAHIKVYVAAALPGLALCTTGVAADLGVQGAAIVANVTECAIAKMNGNGTTANPYDIFV